MCQHTVSWDLGGQSEARGQGAKAAYTRAGNGVQDRAGSGVPGRAAWAQEHSTCLPTTGKAYSQNPRVGIFILELGKDAKGLVENKALCS